MRRSAKILILIQGGIIKKISYERRDYESVDEKSVYDYILGNNIDPSTIYNYYHYCYLLYVYFIHLIIILERSDVRDCKINKHIL